MVHGGRKCLSQIPFFLKIKLPTSIDPQNIFLHNGLQLQCVENQQENHHRCTNYQTFLFLEQLHATDILLNLTRNFKFMILDRTHPIRSLHHPYHVQDCWSYPKWIKKRNWCVYFIFLGCPTMDIGQLGRDVPHGEEESQSVCSRLIADKCSNWDPIYQWGKVIYDWQTLLYGYSMPCPHSALHCIDQWVERWEHVPT